MIWIISNNFKKRIFFFFFLSYVIRYNNYDEIMVENVKNKNAHFSIEGQFQHKKKLNSEVIYRSEAFTNSRFFLIYPLFFFILFFFFFPFLFSTHFILKKGVYNFLNHGKKCCFFYHCLLSASLSFRRTSSAFRCVSRSHP